MLVDRFLGDNGKRLLTEALREQKVLAGDTALIEKVTNLTPADVVPGQSIILQNDSTNSLFLIVAGRFDITVNGRVVAQRATGDCVGEMSALVPTQPRSATVTATEDSVVIEISEQQFAELTEVHPVICRIIAKELAKRLEQRNSFVMAAGSQTRVFIISSVESPPIARAIQNAFARDPFSVTMWTDSGVFKASSYTIPSLEAQVDQSDFAIAIVKPDDTVNTRELKNAPIVRDNVIFELGLFIGRLGLDRTFLVEPWGTDLHLPSDFAGVTPVGYNLVKADMGTPTLIASRMGPACNTIRDRMNELGPR